MLPHVSVWTRSLMLVIVCAGMLGLAGCKKSSEPDPAPLSPSTSIAVQWADMTRTTIRKSPYNSPTYASRSLAYIGLTMYETVVNGSTEYQSLSGQLNGLSMLPQPEAGKSYTWELCLNAGQAWMLRKLYPHAPAETKTLIDQLESDLLKSFSPADKMDEATRSVAYGQAVAAAIYAWSKTDGGDNAYTRTFPPYKLPVGKGYWVSPTVGQSASLTPMHPTWGNNRLFVAENSLLPTPVMMNYTHSPTSGYYAQMKEVYDIYTHLTQQQKEIAAWWGDEPNATAAPPGHSYNLATIAIKKTNPGLFKAAQTYARVGLSVADAFIRCWKCKYTYHAERPSSFIRANIDSQWLPFWPEPPFPAFSSGHSTQGAAAAIVLSDLYGDNFAFIDDTNTDRPKDEARDVRYLPRGFKSFWQAAEETGYSRLLGGIHTRQDNEIGLAEGKSIGENINKLHWKK